MAPARVASALLLFVPLLTACASAPPPVASLTVGSSLARVELEDPNGKTHTIDESLRVLVLSRDMDGGAVVREVLSGDPGLLERTRAVYVADISAMPGFIAVTIAIPRMRGRPFPTLLDRAGDATAAVPSEDGKATVLVLDSLEIREIHLVDSAEDLRAAMGDAR